MEVEPLAPHGVHVACRGSPAVDEKPLQIRAREKNLTRTQMRMRHIGVLQNCCSALEGMWFQRGIRDFETHQYKLIHI